MEAEKRIATHDTITTWRYNMHLLCLEFWSFAAEAWTFLIVVKKDKKVEMG